MKVLVTQSCLILHDPTDCKLPGSSVHGILQARILEWVVIFSSRDQTRSPTLQAESLPSDTPGKSLKKVNHLLRTTPLVRPEFEPGVPDFNTFTSNCWYTVTLNM